MNSSSLARRIERLEASAEVNHTGDLATRLQRARENRHEWTPVFTHSQLEQLGQDNGLVGRVARGWIRIEHYLPEDAPRAMPEFGDPEDHLIATLGGLTHDPYRFVLFGWEWNTGPLEGIHGPRGFQRGELQWLGDQLDANQLLGSDTTIKKAILGGTGTGKSSLACWVLLWCISTFEAARAVATAGSEGQLRTKLAAELSLWLNGFVAAHWFKANVLSISSVDPRWERSWRIDLIPHSEANPSAFQGLHNRGRRQLAFLEEASGVSDVIFDVVRATMSDSDTEKILWCQGNPVLAEGELARAHTAREEWNTVNVDSRTVEGLAQDEIQSWVDAYGIDSDYCRPRVLGIPPRVSLSALFSAEQINEAMLREPPPSETWDPYPVIVSLDPAHLGTNSSCIVTRRGKNMRFMPPIRMTGQNATAVVNRLVQHVTLLRRAGHVVHVVLDQSGMGGPYVDMARERGLNVTGVLFGAVAMQPQRFRNRRAEMFWRLREYIAEGGCLPEDKELREELLAIGAWHDEAGRLQLEAKRDVLAKLGDPGRGIDAADACALSVAVDFALVEDDGAQERVRERRRRYDEDPYSLAGANEYDPVFGAVR